MKPRNIIAAALTAALLAQGAIAPAAQADAAMEVNQGWRIKTVAGGCTIGYNDPAQGASYTAAHCGNPGDKVYLTDAAGRTIGKAAGVFTPSANWDRETISNDWAKITWNPGVKVNDNVFGNDIVTLDELQAGDTVCFHGYTSHGNNIQATCGQYAGRLEESFHFEIAKDYGSKKGDSGGPVFVPGKGFIGVLSGDTDFTLNDQPYRLERANTINDGAFLNWDEVTDFGFSYFLTNTYKPYAGKLEWEAPAAPAAPVRDTAPAAPAARVIAPEAGTERRADTPAPARQAPAQQDQAQQAPAQATGNGTGAGGQGQTIGIAVGVIVALLALLAVPVAMGGM